MSKLTERIITLVIDIFAFAIAWLCYYLIRVESGWFPYYVKPEFLIPMVVISVYWLILFWLFGLYQSWYAKSRLDEVISILKTVTFGVLFLFFAIFIDDISTNAPANSRLLILIYWFLMLFFTSVGRVGIRTLQRKLLEKGIGARNTLIVGFNEKGKEIFDLLKKYPALGYRVVGFIRTDKRRGGEYAGVKVLGNVDGINEIIKKYDVKEIIFALDSNEHDKLLDLIGRCDEEVNFKIVPDLYDAISGLARTNQIYGFPLIEIMPELMKPWEKVAKRLIDIVVSLVVLVVGLPLWILIAILIKLDSRGPIIYKQERVGKDGKIFTLYKFRSMYENAEAMTGPTWATKNDPRVTRIGKILRKLHLDEIPQFFNVLKGDMSLIGPRPERPMFVEKLSKEIPLYKRRLKVKPGITGWAQVKYKYDESIEDVKKKLQYDLFYIENMSLRMDLKIIAYTILHVLSGKGQA
ncbi:undecaprenyl-phosphate glucose phosphotransferase [Candidatus Chrysopegis kryptomonas]|uniref:Undecaprenyl-phosphate glucose phosphotransferase n=1 Tax=Candidatus Chryseopegocella kryptomonas TaxID=1633643 RepID=A0A0P1NUW4_9BACT|nr:undecaprenyl-phosphate glucose phosphotransferase [Candidatus Chrysopegis kryptomonas]CUT02926.1 Undecaprenyl-phosphate glucose phosphotransferase [Candidatus Chrysopegis kryptomonas]